MLRKTSRSLGRTRLSRIVLAVLLVILFTDLAQAAEVNLNVQVLAAPSVTKNDFDFSGLQDKGRVLGAQSERKKTNNYLIYIVLIVNPLLIF